MLKTLREIVTRNAAEFGERTAFIHKGRRVSFEQFNRRVNQLNHALYSLGLPKGDRVAILSRNRTEYVEGYCIGKSGLVGMPINWRLAPSEIVSLLNDSQAMAIMADSGYAGMVDELRPKAPALAHFTAFDEAGEGWLDYQTLLDGASDGEPAISVSPEDQLCLFYTSGATGKPKDAILSHQGLMQNSHEVAETMLNLTPEDVTVSVMVFFHVGGVWYHLFASFLAGCVTIIEDNFNAVNILNLIKEHRATNIHLVPTMISSLIELPGIETASLESLRWVYYAGSSIPVEMLKKSLTVFRKSGFIQSYGSTEGGVCSTLRPEDHPEAVRVPGRESLLLSCGKAQGSARIKIIDQEGSNVGPEEIIAECRKHIAAYKCPKTAYFTNELPKSPPGKILKKKLCDTYGASGNG